MFYLKKQLKISIVLENIKEKWKNLCMWCSRDDQQNINKIRKNII